jgi:hypothetical protein
LEAGPLERVLENAELRVRREDNVPKTSNDVHGVAQITPHGE